MPDIAEDCAPGGDPTDPSPPVRLLEAFERFAEAENRSDDELERLGSRSTPCCSEPPHVDTRQGQRRVNPLCVAALGELAEAMTNLAEVLGPG